MADFKGGFATEEENEAAIRTIFRIQAISSTHIQAWQRPYTDCIKMKQAIRQRRVIASTASPFKFSRSVMDAVKGKAATEGKDEV